MAEICRRLDGIPLAIEFAAARISHLSPAQVAERLGDRFRLLTGGRRRIARQQTLAAALDCSHDLLAAPEQALFRRLAVFAGGFSLAAAARIVWAGTAKPPTRPSACSAPRVPWSAAAGRPDTGHARHHLLGGPSRGVSLLAPHHGFDDPGQGEWRGWLHEERE